MGNSFSSPSGVLVLALLLSLSSFFSAEFSPQEIPLRLAGQAKFPWPQVLSWQQTQADVKVSPEDRIKATIDTYFILLHECLRTSDLLDFGFLFDLTDVKAWNDYAYERGLIYVRIEADKVTQMQLTSYNYRPKYYSIDIYGTSADVVMRPYAEWIRKRSLKDFDNCPWTEHEFKLSLMDGQWKIKSLQCPDWAHNIYPRDTDFEKKAEEAVRELKKTRKRIGLVSKKYLYSYSLRISLDRILVL